MRYASGTLLELSWPRGYGDFWGAKFIGEKGTIERVKHMVSDPPELVAGKPEYPSYPAQPHVQNWIDCMRSRQRPRADVEIAHRSTTLCHLATAARDLGRRLHGIPTRSNSSAMTRPPGTCRSPGPAARATNCLGSQLQGSGRHAQEDRRRSK